MATLARRTLLPPLLAAVAIVCLLLAIAISFGQDAKSGNPLAGTPQDRLAEQLTADLEGTLTPADIRRAQRPLSERKRLLDAHPYSRLYAIARQRFDVSFYLVAAVHYQETGFDRAPAKLAKHKAWLRHRDAGRGIERPARYPNRVQRHPSVYDDFDVVMAIAAGLKAQGARDLGTVARTALLARYGPHPNGRLATAMVIERARAWRLLGFLPLPGRGELATPVKGVVGGCGYFGCPRPGHLHNGVDFLAPTGTPIRAADGGHVAVIESTAESGGYGNFVCLQHRPSLATCYAHLSAFAAVVRPGARVRRGQVIGLVGSTGRSTAPHLHFEVRRGPAACSSCAVDPLPMLSGVVPQDDLPAFVARRSPAVRPVSVTSVVPAPVAAGTPDATAPTPTGDREDGEHDADERTPDIPATDPRGRDRPAAGTPGSGGSPPAGDLPARTVPPVPDPAPASVPPPSATPPIPQQPPAGDSGTGGSVPAVTPPPPPPPVVVPTAVTTPPVG
ncbi:MAG: M23 family metallopeptidase [Solirubrobacteraceae bacterium]|nr:M23 family metallopeptidase [Solirubrobacteraceae bacterium]